MYIKVLYIYIYIYIYNTYINILYIYIYIYIKCYLQVCFAALVTSFCYVGCIVVLLLEYGTPHLSQDKCELYLIQNRKTSKKNVRGVTCNLNVVLNKCGGDNTLLS